MKLSARCNTLIQQETPTKLGDPRNFLVPCEISALKFEKAICNLGIAVSMLTLSKYKKMDVGELMPCDFTLQLADGSVKKVLEILEDVPVKVRDLYIPTDFVVMEMSENSNVTIILGRPFMATVGTFIYIKE